MLNIALICPGLLRSTMIAAIFLCLQPQGGFAQEADPYYYHTIYAHSLSFSGGRTAKLSYLNQRSHIRQFKFAATYIYDAYTKNNNDIKANITGSTLQMQFNTLSKGRLFVNISLGAGGYYLTAKDLLDMTYDEWRFSFVGGGQLELFLIRNALALQIDYEFHYMPWSNIYNFLHVPTAGIIVTFH